MPKMKLTSLAVARLSPPERGQVDYFDTTMPAFGVRVSLAGTKSYFLGTRIQGKYTRLTLGKAKVRETDAGLSLKDAREKAGQWGELVASGIDPRQLKLQERQQNESKARNTFKSVGERFMGQYVKPRLATSTHREYRRTLFGADTAAWSDRAVSSITRADVRAVLDGMVERGSAGAANNRLAYLRKFFNWCAERDIIEIPPTDRVNAPQPKNTSDRTLSNTELFEVWHVIDAEGGVFGDLFKILLLTGQRRSEVGGMRLSELSDLDGDNPLWEIPASRTKNGRPHIVPLSPMAAEIIRERPLLGDEGLLFTTTGTTPVSGYGRAKERLDEHLLTERTKTGHDPIPHWTLHDLRRTMVTMMNEHLGIAPHIVEACVNHLSGIAKAGVAGVYNRALYMRERREALNAWSRFIGVVCQKEKLTMV